MWRKSCAVLLTACAAAAVHAETNVWGGLGGDLNWSTPGNWTNGIVPVGASDLTVQITGTNSNGTTGAPLNQDIADPLDLNRLEIADMAPAGDREIYLSGGRLNFVSAGTVQPTLSGDRDANMIIRNAVSLPAGTTLSVSNRTYRFAIEGAITGEGGLAFGSGGLGGELELKNPANSYTGGTAYVSTYGANNQWARLYVSASGVFGTGPVTLSGGNLNALNAGNQQAGGVTFQGTTAHTNDFLLLAPSPLIAGIAVTNAAVTAAAVTLSGGVDLNAHTLYLRGQRNTSGTLSGVISEGGTNALVKMDLGLWTLSGANTFTGRVLVSSGTLKLGAENTLPPAVPVTVNGGTYDLNGYTVTNGAVIVSSGTVSNGTLCAQSVAATDSGTILATLAGSGGLTKSGAGALTLAASNLYSGVTAVSAGILQFAKRAALYNGDTAQWTDANIVVSSGATLALNVGGAGEFTDGDVGLLAGLGTATGGFKTGAVLGLDTTNAAGGEFACSTVIGNPGGNMLGLNKLGLGTLTLGGANSYTGATRLTGGVLSVASLANGGFVSGIGQSSSNAANLVFAGGALRYTGPTASSDRLFTFASSTGAVFDVAQAGATLTLKQLRGCSGLNANAVFVKNGPGTLTIGNDGIAGGNSYIGGVAAYVINQGSFLTVASDPAQLNLARLAAQGPTLTLGDGAYLGFGAPLNETAANSEQLVRYNGTNVTASMVGITLSGPTNTVTALFSNTAIFDVNDGASEIDLLVTGNFAPYPTLANTVLRKTGTGTLKLAGTGSSHRGTLVIRAGRVLANANVPYGGNSILGNCTNDVQLGDAGTLPTDAPTFVFEGTGAYTFSRGISVAHTSVTAAVVGCISNANATFSGAVMLSNTVQLLSVTAGTNAVFVTGVISGPGGVTKTGTGTVVLAASNAYTGTTTVAAGTLRLSSSNRIDDTSALRLTGGTFDTAGVGETLGALDVDGDAAVDFGGGASVLRFAASAAQTWTGTLTLRNWSGSSFGSGPDRLYVGDAAGGLTPSQLSKILLPDGRKMTQLATGEVVPIAQGTILLAR